MNGTADKDQEDLLRILEAHGQQFLGSFNSKKLKGKRKDNAGESVTEPRKRAKIEHHSEEESSDEWHGFSDSEDNDSRSDEMLERDNMESPEGESLSTVLQWSYLSQLQRLDDEQSSTQIHRKPDIVVFSENNGSSSSTTQPSRAQMKAFMVRRYLQEIH